MRKILLSCIGVAVIVATLFLGNTIANRKKKKKPVPEKTIKTVFTDTVKNTSIQITIPANGSLVAKRRLELFSEVQGVFVNHNKLFRAGQTYKKGEALIRINAEEYRALVQASKSNFYNALVGIMPDMKLDFPDVYSKWQAYVNQFNFKKQTPALPELTSDKEKYFITGRGILSAYYNLKTQEQRLLKYTIRAPYAGIVTEALITEGALVRNGQKLGEFIAPTLYEMEVALGKEYAEYLEIGKKVTLQNTSRTQTFTGKISRINGKVDLDTQTISAFIDVNGDGLKEGLFLEAQLQGKKEAEAIEIARNLLLEDQTIFSVKNGVLDLIKVTPVYFSDTKVVLKGVPNGTVILKQPVPGAYKGMRVKPYTTQQKTN
jgi:multidrug efflux pump subunit AcrA (membrane-fusion protein)